MNRTAYILTLLALVAFTILPMHANNVQVSAVTLVDRETTNKHVKVQFTVGWENSWVTSSTNPPNHDAVWVFVKYRTSNGDGQWRHAKLHSTDHSYGGSTGSVGLVTPGGAFDASTNYGVGVMLPATGPSTTLTNVQLRWNYGVCVESSTANDYVDDSDQVEVRVFAIEMVFVPQGTFYVGSGGTDTYSFTRANDTSRATSPFEITATAPRIQGNDVSSDSTNLGARGAMDLTGTATASLAIGFPTGYNAFYCMKYEISQGQYRDFLNTLTRVQQNTRTETSLGDGTTSVVNRYVMSNTESRSYRNGIRCDTTIHASAPITFYCDYDGDGTGDESTDGEWIACNHLSWTDGAAYSDWAGLRPMTELEFEKACRGTATPVANEYAWGSTSMTQATGITDAGFNNETANAGANVGSGIISPKGPLRVGAYAKYATTRESSGASYWGIMELSGNLQERCVTIGNPTGRAFTGACGDGVLPSSGNADTNTWPGMDAAGAGSRGASFFFSLSAESLRVSDRYTAAETQNYRRITNGFRSVR